MINIFFLFLLLLSIEICIIHNVAHTLSCKVLCHPDKVWRTYWGWWLCADNCTCHCRNRCRVSRFLPTSKYSVQVFPYHPEMPNVCPPTIVESSNPLSMSAERILRYMIKSTYTLKVYRYNYHIYIFCIYSRKMLNISNCFYYINAQRLTIKQFLVLNIYI